jgi:hypothetical protein
MKLDLEIAMRFKRSDDMKFTLEIDCDNAAFEDDPGAELGAIRSTVTATAGRRA